MKKAIIGLVAIGAILGLRPVMRRKAQKMREHCQQMMGQSEGGAEMPEHCKEMMGHSEARSETPQHSEPVAV